MGRAGFAPDDLPARGHAVETGKHEVHQDQVDRSGERCLQTGPAVVLLKHVVAGPPQVVGDQVGDGRIVLDQQDALLVRLSHRPSPATSFAAARPQRPNNSSTRGRRELTRFNPALTTVLAPAATLRTGTTNRPRRKSKEVKARKTGMTSKSKRTGLVAVLAVAADRDRDSRCGGGRVWQQRTTQRGRQYYQRRRHRHHGGRHRNVGRRPLRFPQRRRRHLPQAALHRVDR